MLEFMEKSFLTAIGAMALSQQKAEEMSRELREKLNMSEEEGKNFMNRVQEAVQQNQQKLEQVAQQEVKKACERMGVVTQDEFNALKRKVTQLEKKLKESDS